VTTILKVLTGSRAYGLETEGSDWDYHGVFVTPTSELLSIGPKPKESVWKEGDEDFQSWEVGHFLHLATKCNPTVLETFVAPFVESTPLGFELRSLFESMLARKRVFDAFRGYAHNQRTKLFQKPDDPAAAQPSERAWKFATQYLRVLLQGERLLRTGNLVLNMHDYGPPDACVDFLRDVKAGQFSMGSVIDKAAQLEDRLEAAYNGSSMRVEPDLEAVNEFLLRVRKEHWDA
jgi:predicted nucleotidyltransferase